MKKRKWALNLLFLGAVMGATIWGVFHGSNMDSLLKLVGSADWRWWLLGFGLVALFIGGESLVLHCIMSTLRTPHRLTHCFLYSFVGFFFSCITPSAGGGQGPPCGHGDPQPGTGPGVRHPHRASAGRKDTGGFGPV